MPSFPAFTQPTHARRAVVIVCLALVYVAAALLGFRHAIVAEQVTLVWPPSGIALCAVLLLGRWVWPGILFGAFVANLTTGMATPAAAAIAVGNTFEALVAERLLVRARFRVDLARLRDALALIVLAALVSSAVSATIGSTALVLSGLQPPPALTTLWRDWWLGDGVGDLTVAPILLASFGSREPRLAARAMAELGLLAAALVGACLLAFACPANSPVNAYPVHYLVVPFIAWGALRFGPRGGAAAVLVAATIAVASTTGGLGPFARRADEALLLLQLFVAVVAVTGLLLGAASGERRRLTDELRQRAMQLSLHDRRKDEFLATLAHELRNPLAPIAGAVRLLEQKRADPESVERLCRVLDRQTAHLSRLVDDLLDVSRITSGKVQLRARRVELGEIISTAVDMSQPALAGRELALELEVPPEPILLFGDATRLAQVLANLLTNAARHGRQGGHVWLKVEVEASTTVIRVRDDGPGMTPELLARAFDLFAQGSEGGNRPGLGVGLTLARMLVELHGGSVEARSEGPGLGSEFIVVLPLDSGEPAPVAGEGANTPQPPAGTQCRVLVVDDNVDAAEMLAALIELRGHQVFVAYDGVEALSRARTEEPGVILLDIEMPGMNGYEVARSIRADARLSNMRLIAVSGHAAATDRSRSRLSDFDAHMVKPVDPAKLFSAIES